MAQFYDKKRTMLITGRTGTRTIEFDPEGMFGKKTNGVIAPPPYTVQIEVSSRDPQRIANQNQMFLEAYNMAAQTPFPIRFSSLLKILNIDGKDRIQPVIEADEKYQEQMQMMQQQIEQMQGQMQQMQEENDSLRRTGMAATATLANMNANTGGAVEPGTTKIAEAGGGEQTTNALVANARNNLGLPTGATLPT
jgi:hypothetical protein